MFSYKDRVKAVKLLIKYDMSYSDVRRELGYPSRPILNRWINEIAPNEKKHCLSGGTVIEYSHDEKEKAVISLFSRTNTALEVAKEHQTLRSSL